jgi:Methyltransferase domain
VLRENRDRLLEQLPDDALVLEVGGWASPFARADWMLDLMPYETRGLYDYDVDREAPRERFDARRWVRRDICAREPWPFADGEFDFAVCAHTLEDVRDPVWVCAELSRVARAGYVEVPALREELTWGVEGPYAGRHHHRWLVDRADGGLEFVLKPHDLHAHPELHVALEDLEALPDRDRALALWWDGELPARERIFVEARDFRRWLDPRAAGRAGS